MDFNVENHFELRCVKLVNEELTSKLVAMEQNLNGILASQITTKDRIRKSSGSEGRVRNPKSTNS